MDEREERVAALYAGTRIARYRPSHFSSLFYSYLTKQLLSVSNWISLLFSGKHISYVYLINKKLARASKNFGFLSKATRINSGRNSSTDAEERINFLRDGTRWNAFCANERTTLVSISSRESKVSRGSQLVHRFDSIRLSDGWKRHKRGHHRFGQTFDPISFP